MPRGDGTRPETQRPGNENGAGMGRGGGGRGRMNGNQQGADPGENCLCPKRGSQTW